MINYNDRVKFNLQFKTYGHALKITKRNFLLGLSTLCVLIPFVMPLWLVPVASKLLKKDIIIRYSGVD